MISGDRRSSVATAPAATHVTVRPAAEQDMDRVWEVVRESALAATRHPQDGFLVNTERRFFADWLDRAVRFEVAECKTLLLGFVLVVRTQDLPESAFARVADVPCRPTLNLKQTAVRPGWRRQGVGQLLYQHALAGLREQVGAVVIHEPYNAASIAFHERQGFALAAATESTATSRACGLYVREAPPPS